MGRKPRARGELLVGGVTLCVTAGLFLLGEYGLGPATAAVIAAGAVSGALLFRFALPRPWMSAVLVYLSLAVCLALLAVDGPAGVAWIGGFVGGSNLGVWWRAARHRP